MKTTDKNAKSVGRQDTNGKSDKKYLLIFGISLLLIAILLFCLDNFCKIQVLKDLGIELSYIALALIGVLFHLVSRFRTLRNEGEEFKWEKYWFDYIFRAFQAVVYVIIISNLMKKTATNEIALVSLFTGMFIRRVEEAFESLGDRFGDMLRGMLGTYIQRLSPTEQKRILEYLKKDFFDLKEQYNAIKENVIATEAKEIDKKLVEIEEEIMNRNFNKAEKDLFDLSFKIKDMTMQE